MVLGPSAPVCFMRMPDGCPIEQAISRQRLRPGSGFLSVKVTTDGPTRVLQITDVKQRVSEGSNFSLVVDSIEYSSSSLLDFNISVSGLLIQSNPLVRSAFCPIEIDHTSGLTVYPGY